MLRKAAPLLLLALGCFPVPAQAQVKLEWKPQEKFYVDFVSNELGTATLFGAETKTTKGFKILFCVKVLKRNADKSLLIEQVIESLKGTTSKGSGKEEEIRGLDVMVGTALHLTLDDKMNIIKLDGLDAMLEKVFAKDKEAKKHRKTVLVLLEGMLRVWASEVFLPLPQKPAKKGAEWEHQASFGLGPLGTMLMKKKLVFEGQETVNGRELAKIGISAKPEFAAPKDDKDSPLPFKVLKVKVRSSDYKGTLFFDAAAGRPSHSKAKANWETTMTLLKNGKEFEGDSKVERTITIRVHTKKPAEK
jgi:hypothetical protein